MRIRIDILPSLVTLGNLVCGFAAIGVATYARLGPEHLGAWRGVDAFAVAGGLILLAMVFDAVDGQIARRANLISEFGGQLDSICDMVSFGIAPAYVVFLEAIRCDLFQKDRYAWVCATLYVICAALRLARFNVETAPESEKRRYFRGLPTPAAAGVVACLTMLSSGPRGVSLWPAALTPS